MTVGNKEIKTKRTGGVEDQNKKEQELEKAKAEERKTEEAKAKETADAGLNKEKESGILDALAAKATSLKNSVISGVESAGEAYLLWKAGRGPKVPMPPDISKPPPGTGKAGLLKKIAYWGRKALGLGVAAEVGTAVAGTGAAMAAGGAATGAVGAAATGAKAAGAVSTGGALASIGQYGKKGIDFIKGKFGNASEAVTPKQGLMSKLGTKFNALTGAKEIASTGSLASRIGSGLVEGGKSYARGAGNVISGAVQGTKLAAAGAWGATKLAGAGAVLGGKGAVGATRLAIGGVKLAGKALGPLGLYLSATSALDNYKKGNYTEAAFDAAMGGLSVGGTIAMATAAGAMLLASPVLLATAVAAGVGAAGYYGFKYITRNNANKLEMLRYIQYGFSKDKTDYVSKMFNLEEMVKEHLVFDKNSGVAKFVSKKFDVEKAADIFGVAKKDDDAYTRFIYWFGKRFKSIFLTHMSALYKVDPKAKLEDADKLKPEDREKFIKDVSFPNGPYDVKDSPTPDLDSLPSGAEEVRLYLDELKEGFAKSDKKAGTNPLAAKKDKATLDKERFEKQVKADLTVWGSVKETMKDLFKDGIINGLGKAGDNLASTIGSSIGSLITQSSNAIKRSFGGGVDAFEAVRFKTYGLNEMERSKVMELRNLESNCSKLLKFDNTGVATFTGSVEAIVGQCNGDFGVSSIQSPGAIDFITWFNKRFLPVFLAYAGLTKNATGLIDLDAASLALKDAPKYDIATKLSVMEVWSITVTPWRGYDLNQNRLSPGDNLNFLHEKSDKELLTEQKTKATADRTKEIKKEIVKGPNAKAAEVKKAIDAKAPTVAKGPVRDYSKGSLEQPDDPSAGDTSAADSTGAKGSQGKQGGSEAGALNSNLMYSADKYQNVGYLMGGKDPDQGVVDCSGWITRTNKDGLTAVASLIPNFNAAAVKKTIFNGGGAADIIKNLEDNGGSVISKNELTVDKLTEGMIIGETNGASFAKGRYKGIDHIVQVVRDPKTKELMISESHGGSNDTDGVDLTPVADYLKRKKNSKKNQNLFAIDAVSVYKKISNASADGKSAGGTTYAGSVQAVKATTASVSAAPVSAPKPAVTAPTATVVAQADKQAVNSFKKATPPGVITPANPETGSGDTSTLPTKTSAVSTAKSLAPGEAYIPKAVSPPKPISNGFNSFGITRPAEAQVIQNPRADINSVMGSVDSVLKKSLDIQTEIFKLLSSIVENKTQASAVKQKSVEQSVTEKPVEPNQSYSPGLGLKPQSRGRLEPPVSMRRLVV